MCVHVSLAAGERAGEAECGACEERSEGGEEQAAEQTGGRGQGKTFLPRTRASSTEQLDSTESTPFNANRQYDIVVLYYHF